ncbi:MAG: OmpA family protein [Rhodospirillales bacterium]|nr:OmpA family protein [Alphaproteobacteria bacterium]USO03440.1 MAG: OmpA family protein [Rhodospirillales bacterium]
MKRHFKILAILGVACVLSGCSSYRSGGITQEQGLAPMETPPLKTAQDPDLMMKMQGPATQQSRYISASMAAGGVVAPQDSRVTVFPVDSYQAPWSSGASDSPYGYAADFPAQPAGGWHVYFDHGSSSLNRESRQVLEQVAQDAMFAPVERVTVEGHASARSESPDPVQGRILNLKESMNRSYEVSKNLIRQGVPPEKIKTVSWGDSNLAPGISEAEARRVDIFAGER